MANDLYKSNFAVITEGELFAGIQSLCRVDLPIGDRPPEGYLLDFKEKWSDKSLRVVASFANTFGGIIIIGVSENGGKADSIVGEPSTSELKTRLAGAIAASISPTPLYDLAECTLPGDPNRRLAVIRVRRDTRIHYLLKKGEQPVYIRNEDQSIPAPAAELRQLVEREQDAMTKPEQNVKRAEQLFENLSITNARQAGTIEQRRSDRTKSKSSLKIAVVPQQPVSLRLDYRLEDEVDDVVARTFPALSIAANNGIAAVSTHRNKELFLMDCIRDSPDMQTKWLLTSNGEWVYGAQFSLDIAGRQLWSLPDLAIQLMNALRSSHRLLAANGYLGETELFVEVEPGGSVLHVENGTLPVLVFSDFQITPWPQVIPQMPPAQHQGRASARATSTFSSRTDGVDEFLADVLNQLLRDLNYAPDFEQLRQRTLSLSKRLPTYS